MNCNECPMRYVCETILGGKENCVYNEPTVEPSDDSDEESEE